MSTDAEKFWINLANKAARAKGRHSLNAREAQAEYDAASEQPISEAEVESVVDTVIHGPPVQSDEPADRGDEPPIARGLVPVLNRNPAPAAPASDELLDAHRLRILGETKPAEQRPSWKELETRLRFACQQAAQVLQVLGVKRYPVDPFRVAESEFPRLQVVADDFGDRFDGQLEYHTGPRKFLLFLNAKYDTLGTPERTRFSLAHELGHFFLDDHRGYLVGGGKAHASRTEFKADSAVEREADAFAASLLMPEYLFAPLVNEGDLTLARIELLAAEFGASRVSTAIRSVQVSHFPCAVAGIRDGRVAWQFVSDALIEGRCYPGGKGSVQSPTAAERWAAFVAGDVQKCSREQLVKHWFRTYDHVELQRLPVTEHYLPVSSMNTLVVMLTVPEGELFPDAGDD